MKGFRLFFGILPTLPEAKTNTSIRRKNLYEEFLKNTQISVSLPFYPKCTMLEIGLKEAKL